MQAFPGDVKPPQASRERRLARGLLLRCPGLYLATRQH